MRAISRNLFYQFIDARVLTLSGQEESELDLTSEPQLWASAQPASAQPAARSSSAGKRPPHRPTTARVFFNCCRVYAVVRVPEGVLNGQLSSWRFHCPRCGRLSEIPLQ